MNDGSCNLFERVSKKMGWTGKDWQDRAENEVVKAIGKQLHNATSGDHLVQRSVSHINYLSEDEDKENQHLSTNASKNTVLNDSSDDEFDQILATWCTPRTKPKPKKPCSAVKIDRVVAVISDDDSDEFERFLERVKTPATKPRKVSERGSDDSLKDFIVDDDSSGDDFVQTKSSIKGRKKTPSTQNTFRRPPPLSHCASPVFISDSENEEDNVVIKSTWRTRCAKPKPLPTPKEPQPVPCVQIDSPPSPFLPPVSPFTVPRPTHRTSQLSPKRTLSAPSKMEDSSDTEEEFMSLLERLRKKKILTDSSSKINTVSAEISMGPPVSLPPVKRPPKPRSTSALDDKSFDAKTPGKIKTLNPTVSQTEPRHGHISRLATCKTPGCFLESLSNPESSYCRNFKRMKEELTSKLFQMYNTSVFDTKLPVNMSVTWNKKMRKTAGYCITGQDRGGGNRHARIELSEKVCDSADRLRDTLIHEMCHAATWLINGVRDGHGQLWKMYARKCTLVHPELPMVTRCHSYDIKFKFQYQCVKCQNTIGRHSKSLDTQRFVCALCTGKLVLLTPSKPRPTTPFAKFVKENYKSVRQELAEQSHKEVMQKLSVDFASKNKLE